jgi:hypothetical protein
MVVLPCLSFADAPTNVALGEVEAIMNFCVKLDPRLAEQAEKQLKVLTGKVSAGARGGDYKQGYDLVSDALAKIDRQTALAACSSLAPGRSRHGELEGHREHESHGEHEGHGELAGRR